MKDLEARIPTFTTAVLRAGWMRRRRFWHPYSRPRAAVLDGPSRTVTEEERVSIGLHRLLENDAELDPRSMSRLSALVVDLAFLVRRTRAMQRNRVQGDTIPVAIFEEGGKD